MAILIVLYLCLSLMYFTFWFARNRQESVFRLAVILFLPVLGCLLFFFLWLWNRFIPQPALAGPGEMYGPSPANGLNSPGGLRDSPELNRELNLVPVEEALLLNNNQLRKKIMLDILKDDLGRYPALLKLALGNDDSETAHYAATAVIEARRKITLALQEGARYWGGGGRRLDYLTSYADILKQCLDSGLLDQLSIKKLRATYRGVLAEVLEANIQEEKYFADMINCDLAAGDYYSAGIYCQQFMAAHGQSEQPYLMYLKLFYLQRDKQGFSEILKQLKMSSVSVSSSAWGAIKFWDGNSAGEDYENLYDCGR